jgi:hypothetical protein
MSPCSHRSQTGLHFGVMRRFALLTLPMVASACGSDLPSPSVIEKLRVLAVRAEPPEPEPSESVTLSALVVEPLVRQVDGGPTLPTSWLWLACTPPAGASSTKPCGLSAERPLGSDGALPPPCDGTPRTLCTIGESPEPTLTPWPELVAETDSAQLLVTLIVSDEEGGAVGCLRAAAEDEGRPQSPDRCVLSTKRLTVSRPGRTVAPGVPASRNHNPVLTGLALLDGSEATELSTSEGLFVPGGRLVLGAYQSEASERVPELDSDGAYTGREIYEGLTLSWFATAGLFDGGRSLFVPEGCRSAVDCPTSPPARGLTNGWRAPTVEELGRLSPSGQGSARVWAVLRDDRGGVSYLSGVLRAR